MSAGLLLGASALTLGREQYGQVGDGVLAEGQLGGVCATHRDVGLPRVDL
ncbi:hypothetical protein [Frankia sp. Cas8]